MIMGAALDLPNLDVIVPWLYGIGYVAVFAFGFYLGRRT